MRRLIPLLLAAAPAAGFAQDPAPPGEDPIARVLPLCESSQEAARRFCLDEVDRAGDPAGRARERVYLMAATDVGLHDLAAVVYRRIYGAEPPAYAAPTRARGERAAPSPTRRARRPGRGDTTRVIYSQTAFTRPPGEGVFNAYGLGTVAFDWGVTENLQLGFQTAIPIGFLPVIGLGKLGLAFDGGAVGFSAFGGFLAGFIADAPVIFLAGGGPLGTVGNADRYVTAGFPLVYATDEGDGVGVFVQNLGGSIRVSRRVRFGAELYVPFGFEGDIPFGDLALLVWGVRIFGESLWADVALIDPICDGCSEIYEVLPLGIPFLNVGGDL